MKLPDKVWAGMSTWLIGVVKEVLGCLTLELGVKEPSSRCPAAPSRGTIGAVGGPSYLVAVGARPAIFHAEQLATINFTALIALLHLADAEDLEDNFRTGGVCQTPFCVARDLL